jgi:formate/nitrite transporter FocA (FNT family)
MSVRDVKPNPPATQSDSSVQQDLDRPTATDIFIQVSRNARQELRRPALALAVAGVVGGLTMGLTALGVSIASAELGPSPSSQFLAFLLYPIGFMAVILGRGQLFTENTLYPIALVFAERRHYLSTLRLWSVVLPTNLIGVMLFALLAERTGALRPEYVAAMARFGMDAVSAHAGQVFWSGVIGGWIIALVAWMVSGSHSITGSVMVIWVLTFLVGIGHFAHCIATSGEILTAVLGHQVTFLHYLAWLGPALAGNITGGVLLVTLLEYGQVHST